MTRDRTYYLAKLDSFWFIKTMWKLYAIKIYINGGTMEFIWRWWHPLTWIVVPPLVLISVLVNGIPHTYQWSHDIGLGYDPYFKDHPEKIEWL